MSTCNQSASAPNHKRRRRVLLGITGSVAAIKGPELALRLSQDLDAHVVILLTRGGENFWYKAKDYNPQVWDAYCDFVGTRRETTSCHMHEEGDGANDQDALALPNLPEDDTNRSIILFSELLTFSSAHASLSLF